MTSPQVAASTHHRLLARVAVAQASGRLPSVVARVVRDGVPAWDGHVGAEPAPGHRPHQVQYRIGSITKTMTAVLVLRLVGEGRLGLDDPVSDVLGSVGYGDRTVRQLLAHASGMQSEPSGEWWERTPGVDFAELAARHDGAGAVFPPGQRFHYSNLGYALLGEVVARVEGRSWWSCLREQVLAPLGMQRTSYLPEHPVATGYSVHPYESRLVPEPATDTGAMAPAGQLWCTAEDLGRYAVFLLDGHPDVLPLAALREAAHPQSGDRDDALTYAHGLGFQLYAGGSGMLVGHGGSMPGFLAACLVDAERRTGAVVLANATAGFSPTGLAIELLDELERCEPALPRPWRPEESLPPSLEGVPGVWHWGNTALVFRMEAGELVVRREGEEKERFAVRDGEIVGVSGYHAGERLRVVRRPDGSVSHLLAATFVYTRVPYDPEAPAPGGHPW